MRLKIGDVVINHCAGFTNPHRICIVLKVGKNIHCTDGNGVFWELIKDKENKITKIGNILDLEKFNQLKIIHERS